MNSFSLPLSRLVPLLLVRSPLVRIGMDTLYLSKRAAGSIPSPRHVCVKSGIEREGECPWRQLVSEGYVAGAGAVRVGSECRKYY
jgi:hypothetical protein